MFVNIKSKKRDRTLWIMPKTFQRCLSFIAPGRVHCIYMYMYYSYFPWYRNNQAGREGTYMWRVLIEISAFPWSYGRINEC